MEATENSNTHSASDSPSPKSTVTCRYCRKSSVDFIHFCDRCGFPITGSVEQVNAFVRMMKEKRKRVQNARNLIVTGQIALLVVGGFIAIAFFMTLPDLIMRPLFALVALAYAVLSFALAIVAHRNPLAGLYPAAMMLLSFQAYLLVVYPFTNEGIQIYFRIGLTILITLGAIGAWRHTKLQSEVIVPLKV